ncbi:MAG: hypothetical protein AB3X44_16205 [Leptothrix sp. (in: b-proteobacteria)]
MSPGNTKSTSKARVQSVRVSADVSIPVSRVYATPAGELHKPAPRHRKPLSTMSGALRELAVLGYAMPADSPMADIARRIAYITGRPAPRSQPAAMSTFISGWVREMEASKAAPVRQTWRPLQGYSLHIPANRATRHIPSIVGNERKYQDGRIETL